MTVTATQLHDRTAELTDRVLRNPDQPIVVKKHGKAAIVLMDARHYEGLLETLDLLSDPQSLAEVRSGLKDLRTGRVIAHESLRKELGLDGSKRNKNRVGRNGQPRVAARR